MILQEVSKYIEQLLYHHECVILPDFGGFIANYKSAKIDYTNFNFYPPGKDISFNRNLTKNDGLLINHIANVNKVSFLESKKVVVAFVKETSDKLNSGETVFFKGIGKFYFNKQKNLQFEPDLSVNYLLDSYGLSSFHFAANELDYEEPKERVIKFKENIRPVISGRTFVKRAAIIIPAVLLFSVLNYNSKNIYNKFSGVSSLIPVSVIQNNELPNQTIPEDTIIATVNVENEISTPEPELLTPPVPEKRYYLIAGSFLDSKHAGIFSDKLKKSDFSPELLPVENGKYRVAFSAYTDKKEALVELQKIRQTIESNAWMLYR